MNIIKFIYLLLMAKLKQLKWFVYSTVMALAALPRAVHAS